MNIQLRRLGAINLYERDPHLNEEAVAAARSVREFGFRQPIVIDDVGVMVIGHTRWKAAKKMGRSAFLIELNRLRCDVIVQRWEKFTGRKAGRTSDRSDARDIAEALEAEQ